ncbi:MAG TPA: cytochrome c peroxidase [Pyrinomonadaceae bacterium]|jgi:cytochrome c peroxidase
MQVVSSIHSRIATIKLILVGLFIVTGSLSINRPSRAGANLHANDFTLLIPAGIPEKTWRGLIPAGNPLTVEKVALGEALFFDKRLSADGTVSCATCHDPATAFADHNPVAVGVAGKMGTRNVPTMLNAVFNDSQFWDGHARTLEEQARQPLINPVEMGMGNDDAVVARVAAVPEYRRRFQQVFGAEGVSIDTIVKAIASFERTQLSGNSPFDRFMAGDENALSDSQKRGFELFRGKARCAECHAFSSAAPFFTDFRFHNTGIATKDKNFHQLARIAQQIKTTDSDSTHALDLLAHSEGFTELGRYIVTKQREEIGAFKTPTLRDVELTAPYMHNGSKKTLLDVVRFYNKGGEVNLNLDQRIGPLRLTEEEMSNLVEFMRALTSDDVLRRVQSLKPQTRKPIPLS